jgi:hypothetical protein
MHPINRKRISSEYTWSVPTGRPWVLGDLEQIRSQWQANQQRYDEIKRAANPIVSRFPWSEQNYTTLAQRIVALPRGSIVRLSMEQFALLTRATLSTVSVSQNFALALLSDPTRPEQEARARKLVLTARNTLEAYETILRGIQRAQGAARYVGLGDPVVAPSVVIAGIIAAAIVLVVAGVLVYNLIATQQANEAAVREAEQACARDAAQGRPCSGAEYTARVDAARREQQRWGNIPNLDRLFQNAGSLFFWGGLIVIGGLLGYAAWTAEPARRNLQERLRQGTSL